MHNKVDTTSDLSIIRPTVVQGGNSSVGRARPCQGRGREFESRFPLQICTACDGAMAEWSCSGLQLR